MFFIFLLEAVFQSVNIFSIIPIAFIGIGTVYSLYKIFNLISNDLELKKEERNQFFNRVQYFFLKTLDLEITRLIGSNLIYQRFKANKKIIHITPYTPVYKEKYTEIKSKKTGFLKDLNLKILEDLLWLLKESTPLPNREFNENPIMQNIQKDLERDIPLCYLVPKLYSDLKEVNNTLFWIRSDLINSKEKRKDIEKIINQIFKIGKSNFDLEKAREEIRRIRYLSIDLIQNNQPDELREALNNYKKLVDSLYSFLSPYGRGFSKEQADSLSLEISFGRSYSFQWIVEDVHELSKQSIKSNNETLIREVNRLLFYIMFCSIEHRDHLLFQQFQHYLTTELYHEARSATQRRDVALANFLFDESTRYLKDLFKYYLKPKIEDKNYPKKSFKEFSISILKLYQGLLYLSFEKQDINIFKKYMKDCQSLFSRLYDEYLYENDELKETVILLKNKKEEMFFGVSSWILHKFYSNKTDINKQFYNLIQKLFPSEIKDFTSIFLKAHKDQDLWKWSIWELSEKEKEEAHFIKISEKLQIFYLIKGLSLLEEMEEKNIQNIRLPYDRYFLILSEDFGIMKTLNKIKDDFNSWRFILSDKSKNKIDLFKKLFFKANKTQNQQDAKEKRTTNISQAEVALFKKEVLESFYKSAIVRDIFKSYLKIYKDTINHQKTLENKNRFGIHHVIDKALFLEKEHILHMPSDNIGFAQNISSPENTYLTNEISGHCEEINEKDFSFILTKFENIEDVFILYVKAYRWFSKCKNFKPRWHEGIKPMKVKGFYGCYTFNRHKIPVFNTYSTKNDKQILILNKNKLGQFIQMSPLNKGENEHFINDIFYMDIKAFSEDEILTQNMVKNPPQWLKKIGDEQKQKEYLQERVLIQIYERFEFIVDENFQGYKLSL